MYVFSCICVRWRFSLRTHFYHCFFFPLIFIRTYISFVIFFSLLLPFHLFHSPSHIFFLSFLCPIFFLSFFFVYSRSLFPSNFFVICKIWKNKRSHWSFDECRILLDLNSSLTKKKKKKKTCNVVFSAEKEKRYTRKGLPSLLESRYCLQTCVLTTDSFSLKSRVSSKCIDWQRYWLLSVSCVTQFVPRARLWISLEKLRCRPSRHRTELRVDRWYFRHVLIIKMIYYFDSQMLMIFSFPKRKPRWFIWFLMGFSW